MYLPREIKAPDTFDVGEAELQDDRMPVGAGFLIIVCASLLFWLMVLLIFTHA